MAVANGSLSAARGQCLSPEPASTQGMLVRGIACPPPLLGNLTHGARFSFFHNVSLFVDKSGGQQTQTVKEHVAHAALQHKPSLACSCRIEIELTSVSSLQAEVKVMIMQVWCMVKPCSWLEICSRQTQRSDLCCLQPLSCASTTFPARSGRVSSCAWRLRSAITPCWPHMMTSWCYLEVIHPLAIAAFCIHCPASQEMSDLCLRVCLSKALAAMSGVLDAMWCCNWHLSLQIFAKSCFSKCVCVVYCVCQQVCRRFSTYMCLSLFLTGQTALYENIGRHEALWTFDITASAWTQRRASGELPDPHLACALAVVNGRGYVLANDPEGSKRLEVYELDLTSWEWRQLPPVGTQPSCRRAASAVVVQVGMLVPLTLLHAMEIITVHMHTCPCHWQYSAEDIEFFASRLGRPGFKTVQHVMICLHRCTGLETAKSKACFNFHGFAICFNAPQSETRRSRSLCSYHCIATCYSGTADVHNLMSGYAAGPVDCVWRAVDRRGIQHFPCV